MTERSRWQDRKHSCYVSTRYFSGGWEFDTDQAARKYVSDQYAQEKPENRANTPFRATVKSNGVHTHFWGGDYGAVVRKATYVPGETMREAVLVDSPSDCYWMVPNTGHD